MIPLFLALIDTTISSSSISSSSYSSDSSSPSRTPSASTSISTSESSPPSESPQLGSSRGLLYSGLKSQHLVAFLINWFCRPRKQTQKSLINIKLSHSDAAMKEAMERMTYFCLGLIPNTFNSLINSPLWAETLVSSISLSKFSPSSTPSFSSSESSSLLITLCSLSLSSLIMKALTWRPMGC